MCFSAALWGIEVRDYLPDYMTRTIVSLGVVIFVGSQLYLFPRMSRKNRWVPAMGKRSLPIAVRFAAVVKKIVIYAIKMHPSLLWV